jgi:hypothetical protein
VRRWQREAGTTAERETAKQELELATSTMDEEGPKIESKIAELQQKLRSLQRDNSTVAAKVERHAEAVKQLRELVPPHVKDRKERHLLTVNALRGELRGVRGRQQVIEKTAAINIDTLDGRRAAILIAQAVIPEAVNFDNRSGPDGEFVRKPWLAYIQSIRAELPGLQSREGQLVAELKVVEADLQGILDHYAQ